MVKWADEAKRWQDEAKLAAPPEPPKRTPEDY
jgi:hypothetical protein